MVLYQSKEYLENDSIFKPNNDLYHQLNARYIMRHVFKNYTDVWLISGSKETSYLSRAIFPKIDVEGPVQACSQESSLALNTDTCDPALAQGLPAQAPDRSNTATCNTQRLQTGLLGAGASGAEGGPDWSAAFWPPGLGLQRLSAHLPSRPELSHRTGPLASWYSQPAPGFVPCPHRPLLLRGKLDSCD